MGKKSRTKKERKLVKTEENPSSLLLEMLSPRRQQSEIKEYENAFKQQINSLRALFRKYESLEVAFAL